MTKDVPRHGLIPFLIGWCICLIVLELYGALFLHNMRNRPSGYDFEAYYAAGVLMRTDLPHLYNQSRLEAVESNVEKAHGGMPFYHPPYEVPIYALFSLLPYRTAYFSYIGFNMVLLLATFFVARPAFSSILPWWQLRPGLMLFLFVPMVIDVIFGQDALLVLLFCSLAWRQLNAGKDASAGCFLALALFKFQIILPIAVLLAIRRGRRFSAGFAATAAALLLACFGMVGRSGMTTLLQLFVKAAASAGQNVHAQPRFTPGPLDMSNLTGLVYAVGGRFLRPPILFEGLSILAILALFLWCLSVIRRYDDDAAFSLAILCALLANNHSYFYDVTLALLPLALMANRIPRYVVAAMFFVPVIVAYFLGYRSVFLMAIPMLVMLLHVHLSATRTPAPAPVAANATAS